MTIYVSLNTANTPPVTCSPAIKDKDHGKNDVITWKRAHDTAEFDFYSLVFGTNPGCFGEAQFSTDNQTMTVTDDNSGGTSVGLFGYTVTVITSGGQKYNSASGGPGEGDGDPMIHNK